jgi:hypothetical protein
VATSSMGRSSRTGSLAIARWYPSGAQSIRLHWRSRSGRRQRHFARVPRSPVVPRATNVNCREPLRPMTR